MKSTRGRTAKIILWLLSFTLFSFPLLSQDKTVIAAADDWGPYVDRNDPHDGLSLAIIREPLSVKSLYIAVGRENSRGREIISVFNRGLQAIKKDGMYREILESNGI